MALIHCDRCGRGIHTSRDPADTPSGECPHCGEYLCGDCARDWYESADYADGICERWYSEIKAEAA